MKLKIIDIIMSTILDNPISKSIKKDKFESKILNISEHPADPRDWVHSSSLNKTDSIDLNEFSRRKLCPKVANQGSIGSCVGHSGRVVLGSSNVFKKEEPSPMWIYKTAKKYDAWAGEDYSGTSIRGAASALINEGCCFESFWPYVSSELSVPKEGAKEDAALKKISSYHVIPANETVEIKKMLLDRPMWYAFKVRSYFFSINYSGIVDTKKYLSSDLAGGHAVCLIGWKYTDGKLYWEFQNSWGFFFGNNGCFFMEDSLFQSHIINSIGPYYLDLNKGFYNEPVDPEPEPIDPKPEPVDPKPEPIDPKPEPVDPKPEPVDPKPEPVDPKPEPVDPKPKNKNKVLIAVGVIALVAIIFTFTKCTNEEELPINWDEKLDKELMKKGTDRDALLRDYKRKHN
jgi:hypothetical protein